MFAVGGELQGGVSIPPLRWTSNFDRALEIYEEHKRLREQDIKLSEQERTRLIANEDKNIVTLQQEMQALGLV